MQPLNTNLTRRRLLKTGALVSVALLGGSYGAYRVKPSIAMLSGASDRKQNHFAVLLDNTGAILSQTLLPSRSHAAVYNNATNEALFFSRRPGNALYVINPGDAVVKKTIYAETGRHFYGHGILTSDNKYLLATENDYEAGVGKITIRDANNNYALTKEIPSFGVGPHELAFMPDNRILVVANGGLRTHPKKNRIAQNIQTMRPNVSFIDWQAGILLAQYEPDNLQMGLRHLSVRPNGDVIIGVQYKGGALDDVPLVLKANLHEGLTALSAVPNFSHKNNQYTASVCNINNDTWVSCPKSHRLTRWSREAFVGSSAIKDVAGIAHLKSTGALMVSNGAGVIARVHYEEKSMHIEIQQHYATLRWDNHLISVI